MTKVEETKLFSKVQVHVNSKKADEVAFRSHIRKLEMVIMHMDLVTGKRSEVKTIDLDLKSAKRIRAVLDVHIKMFET